MENPADSFDVRLVDQDELESSITQKANKALITKESELEEKRLQKTTQELDKARRKIQALESRLNNPRTKLSSRKQLRDEISWFQENELEPLLQDVKDIQARLESNREQLRSGVSQAMAGESEKDFLIRTGKITAFGSVSGFSSDTVPKQSSTNLRAPGFLQADPVDDDTGNKHNTKKPTIDRGNEEGQVKNEIDRDEMGPQKDMNIASDSDESSYNNSSSPIDSNSANVSSAGESDDEILSDDTGTFSVTRNVDDGDENVYQERLKNWTRNRANLRVQAAQANGMETADNEEEPADEWLLPHPTIPDAALNESFRLPGDIFPSLFDYQKTCVQWLWELYSQKTGGIIGDEMGLGKTIQVIAFIAGLHHSGLLDKPVLLVVPATVMNQWVNEFHTWWPPLRCVILHSIGSGMSKSSIKSEEQLESHLEEEILSGETSDQLSKRMANNQINAKEVVDRVMRHGHVLITTYVGLRIYSKHLLPHEWGYAVLDEGHKIRNPNSEISLTCKRVKTHNRIILSGTPIQNNLIELWSLFDFVFPGRLGTLPVFEQQFAVPINMGGYANASNVQVQTGYQCAVILRDLISPYLLRRLKVDVAQDLPKKNEMVLFVKLTQFQQDMYEKFLGGEDVNAILKGRRNVLMGVDMLRKICNHPDLVDREMLMKKKAYNYGNPAKSGKMLVLKNLLQLWKSQGHRTLLFCQTKQMLDILEKFVANLAQLNPSDPTDVTTQTESRKPFEYLRMDGSTPIARRQDLVDSFNNNPRYHVFLLTTKVGGLGVNLTGADRVIIFDPDWNPSTDIQARERAWRLGQKKDITIYRLMTAGTIEEKIYHRQIFKTFLTNKILKDPKQRRFFKLNDLHDLFTLGDPDEKGTETGDMFDGSEQTFGGARERKSMRLSKKGHTNDDDFYQVASIMGVSKLDKFMDEDDNEVKQEEKDEDRIMEGIFSNAGVVHSTLKHDDVVDSSRHETSIVEREASRVAKEAAEALKKSRMLTRKVKVGVPTWTGRFGAAGRFGPVKKPKVIKGNTTETPEPAGVENPLSSASILHEFRRGKAVSGKPSFSPFRNKTTDTSLNGPVQDKKGLLKHLIDYLSSQPNGFSKSNAILQSLPKSLDMKNEKDMIMVRSLLREAAEWNTLEKGWTLKKDFVSDETQEAGGNTATPI